MVVLILLLLPDIETIKEGFREIKNADTTWVLLGFLLFLPVIPMTAMQLIKISEIKLKFYLTFKVQMALQFIGKLLPASIGSLVVNSFYIHKIGHNSSQTASIIAMRALT